MQLTEKDPELRMCGFLLSHTGLLPTDPCFQKLVQQPLLLSYTYYWANRRDEDNAKLLMRMLGVHWTWEDFNERKDNKNVSEMFVPLSMMATPHPDEWRKFFKKSLHPPSRQTMVPGRKRRDGFVELGELPKEQFLAWAQTALLGAGIPIVNKKGDTGPAGDKK